MTAIFEKIDKIKPFYDVAYKVTMFICKLLMVFDILVTTMMVLGRYIPFIPSPAWTEEVVLTLMAYLALISAAMALRRNAHIRMTSFDPYLPKKVVKVLDVLADIAILAFSMILIIEGWKYCTGIGSKGFYTSMPWLSKFWQYFCIPTSGVAMVIFELETLYNHIKALFVKEADAK